jgi:hypothetical protein
MADQRRRFCNSFADRLTSLMRPGEISLKMSAYVY